MAEFEDKLSAILGNQEAMGQIMALARSLSPEKGQEEQVPVPNSAADPPQQDYSAASPVAEEDNLGNLLGQIDPGMIQMGMQLFSEYQGTDDRNANLLQALRPFLREERRAKLDKAMQMARMTRLIRVALKTLGRKGDEADV